MGGVIGNRPGPDPVWLLLPLVFDLAKESRAEECVGLLDVGEICREQNSLDLESSISIDGSNLSGWADDQEFVAATHDLKLSLGFALFAHLPRNSEPVDLQPLARAALNRMMERKRKFVNFIKGLHGW